MDHIKMMLDNTQIIFKKNILSAYLFSAIFTISLSSVFYTFFDINQNYSELIVGSITWNYENKFHDYSLLFFIVFGFVTFFLFIGFFLTRLEKTHGQQIVNKFNDLLILLSVPAVFWFFGLISSKNLSFSPIYVSTIFFVISIFFGFILTTQKKFSEKTFSENHPLLLCIQEILVLFICSVFSSAAIGILISHLIPALNIQHLLRGEYVVLLTAIILFILFLFTTYCTWANKSIENIRQKIQRLILVFQIPLPFLFLVLIPAPWFVDGKIIQFYSLSTPLLLVVSFCMTIGYWNLLNCFKKTKEKILKPLDLISWISIIGVILFIKINSLEVPNIWSDDYHFGEILTPWWSFSEHNAIPFWDYAPARGLMNYFPGAFSAFFFDGTPATFSATHPLLYLLILFISFPVFSEAVGKGNAAVAFLLAPYINHITEIDILVTVFICFLCQKFFKLSPIQWLVTSFFLAIAIILYAPGQGGLAVLAVFPLVCIMLYRFCINFKNSQYQTISIVILISLIVLVGFYTPLGKMIFGSIRYGLEQSHVNSIANGTSWKQTFNTSNINPWIFELIRVSWLVVTIFSAILIFKTYPQKASFSRNILLTYSLTIFLITLFFIIRAAGRIDSSFGGVSRLGIASIWVISFLLPILLFSGNNNKNQGKLLLIWVSIGGIIFPFFGSLPNNIVDFYKLRFTPIHVDSSVLKGLSETKLIFPNIGYAKADSGQVNRLILIRDFLDTVLEKNETYLDLTNRGAQYFYLNRKQPIESGAIYNLVTEAQQLRAIESLKITNPPAILIAGDNINHDGGGANLRSYLLYRYLLLLPNYKVVKTSTQVWLLRSDRLARLNTLNINYQSSINDAPDNLLNNIFRVPDLLDIPASWGRSYKKLNNSFYFVYKVSEKKSASNLNSLEILKNNYYQINGDDPSITFDISDLNLNGKDVGLISFDFKCDDNLEPFPKIEFYWDSNTVSQGEMTVTRFNARNGRLVVPVDSVPSWLLTNNLRTIRFDLLTQKSCKVFKIGNINLLQRNSVNS